MTETLKAINIFSRWLTVMQLSIKYPTKIAKFCPIGWSDMINVGT